MKLSPIYVERLAESNQIRLQEGLQQDLPQEANLIIHLPKRKIGNLSPDLENKMISLSRQTLED